MIVCPSADESVAVALHSFRQGARIFYNLLLITLEGWLLGFVETDRLGRNHMHQRPSLDAGESLRINFFGKFLFAQDQAATRPAQSLVRRRRHEIGVLDR